MTSYLPALALFILGLIFIIAAALGRPGRRQVSLGGIGVVLWLGCLGVYSLTSSSPSVVKSVPTVMPSPTVMATPSVTHPRGRIVFHSERTGDFDIWVMNDDGTDQRQLTDAHGRDIEPAWSPDGRKIAFASARDDPENLQLYIMNADGSDQHPLLPFEASDNWSPAWSPDGQKIAYQSNRDHSFEIYVVNADGTGRTRLTGTGAQADGQPSPNNSMPSWSPDGKRIAFVSDRDGNHEIYVMNADGSDQRRLTNHPADDVRPRWSPDGQYILFESDRHGRRGLYVIPAPGANPQPTREAKLLTDARGDYVAPNWAWGGEAIVFSANIEDHDWEIYIMNADGSGIRRLTFSPRFDRFPSWTAVHDR
ncbi:MAG: PD40 domain-containing protein [Anaerolineae bacterium]|nr:PD40 domain-containing protein [Anaerolineae bacterium]